MALIRSEQSFSCLLAMEKRGSLASNAGIQEMEKLIDELTVAFDKLSLSDLPQKQNHSGCRENRSLSEQGTDSSGILLISTSSGSRPAF